MKIDIGLVDFLIDKGVLPQSKKDAVIKECEQKNLSVEKLVWECSEGGFLLLSALGEYYGLPYAEIGELEISDEVIEKYNPVLLKRLKMLPLSQSESECVLAIGYADDYLAKGASGIFGGGSKKYILVPPKQIDELLDSVAAKKSATSALKTVQNAGADSGEDQKSAEPEEVINAPVVRLVDSIIKEAIPLRASDIHIEPYEKTVRVRYRIDGELLDRASFPIEAYSAVCARLKILAGLNIAERRIPQDGRINMSINGSERDFRVSVLPTVYGEKVAVRILDKTSFGFTRADLGFTAEENAVVDKMLANPHGIVLLTGPTGCGKSTTLYSFLKEKNSPSVNIVTVEDPVEYTVYGVNQIQVNAKAGLTFASALRGILRQDPDVIMIGEIRDEETADIAIRASITGHLVFSTLHTNDAVGAFTRLIDMGVSDYLVKDALIGVIAQRLVKRLCPSCKKRSKTTEDEMKMLGLEAPATVYRARGCPHCSGTGYVGRIAVHEILYLDGTLKAKITSGMTADDIRSLAKQNGMDELSDSCKRLVLSGVTDTTEFLSVGVK